MTMAPQRRRDSDDSNNSHDGGGSGSSSHEDHDAGCTERVRVADAGLRRSIIESSTSSSNNSTTSSSTTTTSQDIQQQRRPRRRCRAADDIVRRSATITRRHSSPGPTRSSPSPPPQENKAGAAIRRRKKCRPRHRCPTTNESISSILKPYPKYLPSATILQSLSSETTTGSDDENDNHTSSTLTSITSSLTLNKKSSFLRRGSANSTQSEPSLPAASMHSFFLPGVTNNKPLDKSQKRPSCDSLLDQQWVPNGVDFSSSVEVHVFHVKE